MKLLPAGSARLARSVAAAAAASLAASAAASQSLAASPAHVNATASLVADYAAFYAALALVHYAQNRRRWALMGRAERRRELLGLAASLGVAEAAYAAARWPAHYWLLDAGLEPYAASLASQAAAGGAYLAAAVLASRLAARRRG